MPITATIQRFYIDVHLVESGSQGIGGRGQQMGAPVQAKMETVIPDRELPNLDWSLQVGDCQNSKQPCLWKSQE